MKTTRHLTKSAAFFLPAIVGLASALGGACNDSGESTTTLNFTTGSGGGSTSTTTTTTTSAQSGTGGAGGNPDCLKPEGCWDCAPVTLPEFLNHCTDSQCSPFDNVARLPLYNGGNLPSLP